MLCKKPFSGFGCGQCIPCRINLRRVWTNRIMLESTLHPMNGFLTLTYDDDHLPSGGSLVPKDTQDFLKRLRSKLPIKTLRYYLVGEYGDQTQRPHYHAALFGLGCKNKIQRPETGLRCYCDACELVRSSWQNGNITLDELNETTAAYVGGYVLKKMTSKNDSRLVGRYPEFSRSSRQPGLARDAIAGVAKSLTSEYGHLAFKHGDIPHALQRGKSKVPLGRYLKQKIREDIKLEKINIETGEVTYGTPHQTIKALQIESSPEMCLLPQKAYEALSKGESFSPFISEMEKLKRQKVSSDGQKILNMETKHKIYQSAKRKKL